MRKDRYFQRVFDCIDEFLPEQWNKVVFYAEYDEGSYCIEFWVNVGSGYVKCYDLPGIPRTELRRAFADADEFICSERETLSENDLWSSMTMVVKNNGKVQVDYDYTDLTEVAYEHKQAWKKKYLL